MQLTGVVTKILPVESGTSKTSGKDWKKGAFILHIDGTYPKDVYVTLFGKALDNVSVEAGKKYDVDIEISSRSWTNEKTGKESWFTEVSAWRAVASQDAVAVEAQPQSALQSLGIDPDKPHVPQNTPQESSNDLPF